MTSITSAPVLSNSDSQTCDSEPCAPWHGYDCSPFVEYLDSTFYGRLVGDAWRDDPLYAMLIIRERAFNQQSAAFHGVYKSFAVAKYPVWAAEAIVAPRLACAMLTNEAGDQTNCTIGKSVEIDNRWNATPSQIACWFAGVAVITETGKHISDTGDVLELIEELRYHAEKASVDANAACDAFAALCGQQQAYDALSVDLLIEAAIATVA